MAEVAEKFDYRYDSSDYLMVIGKARRDKSRLIITALYYLIHQHIKHQKDVRLIFAAIRAEYPISLTSDILHPLLLPIC